MKLLIVLGFVIAGASCSGHYDAGEVLPPLDYQVSWDLEPAK